MAPGDSDEDVYMEMPNIYIIADCSAGWADIRVMAQGDDGQAE